MINPEIKNKRTLDNDPQYFGDYLNTARHNVFVINNNIVFKFTDKEKILTNEDDISGSKIFISNKLKKKQNHIFSHLEKLLPIVKVFNPEKLPTEKTIDRVENADKEIKFDEMAENLQICFKKLNSLRNDFSHYYSIENEEKKILEVSEKLSNFISINYKRAIEFTKKRFKNVFEEQHFELATNMANYLIENNKITEKGLVFFTCLFLDRENAFHFINKIIGFKATHTQEFKATREVFSVFCVKLPHNRFVSENPKQALALEMLNELDKCPKNLFEVLTDFNKLNFLPTINTLEEDYEDYSINIIKRTRYSSRFNYFALQYLDSTQFTEKILFHINLGRYQIDKYDKKFLNTKEERPIVENAKAFGRLEKFLLPVNTDTIAIEEIKKEAKKYYEEKISNKIDTNTSEFEQFAPHYNIKQNKIGFKYIAGRGSKDAVICPKLVKSQNIRNKSKYNLKLIQPNAFLSIHELKKIVLLNIIDKGKAEQIIDNFFKLNNTIFDINFIEEVKKQLYFEKTFYKKFRANKNKTAYNNENRTDLKTRKIKLNEILENYNLNDKQIPSRIINYWLAISAVKNKHVISNRIKTVKKDCSFRIKNIKQGKSPKIGEMATFLAHDIVDLIIEKEVKQKITSFYYHKMQECLALYADKEKKDIFHQICNELNLLNKDKGHPFLVYLQINKINNTSEFYEKYLTEKGTKKRTIVRYNRRKQRNEQREVEDSWIFNNFYNLKWNEKAKKQLTEVELPENMKKLPLSIRNLNKEKNNFSEWLENRKKLAVDLPTNIFDNAIKIALQKILDKKGIIYKQSDKYHYLLKLWFGENNLQGFYNYEREYIIYDEKINFTLGTKPKIKNYFYNKLNFTYHKLYKQRELVRKTNRRLPSILKKQVLAVFNNVITENEKAIRFNHETDRILLLIIKNTIESDNDLNIKLNELKNTLNENIEIKQKISGKLSFEPNKGKQIEKTIVDNRKRKDFSILKKFVHDRRLPELFEYFKDTIIQHSKLKKELQTYNKVKELIFDHAFVLEKKLIEIDRDEIISLHNTRSNKSNIQHEPYLMYLKNKNLINENEFVLLNIVRNTFSHNQFPPKATIEKFADINNSKTFSEQIYQVYDSKIREVLQKIDKI